MKTKSFSQAHKPVPGMLHVIERVIPGIIMVHPWQRRWLRVHLVTGVTIFAMLILQGDIVRQTCWSRSRSCLYTAIGALARLSAFWEFTASNDWYRGNFRNPGGHNAVAGHCQERVSE